MSKIYDALKKRDAERSGAGTQPGDPAGPPSGGGTPPTASGREPGPVDPIGLPVFSGFPEQFWQAVNRVTAAIQASHKRERGRVVFVGAEREVGTTTIALATACLLVRDPGVRVLLVDAHSRQEGQRLLPNGQKGVIQIATGEATPREAIAPTEMRGLSYLPRGAGSYNGPKLLERLVPLLATLQTRYDYIVLDAPPVVTAPESARLAGFCDGVVVVIEAERTPKTEAVRTREILDDNKANILGTVINRVRRSALIGQR